MAVRREEQLWSLLNLMTESTSTEDESWVRHDSVPQTLILSDTIGSKPGEKHTIYTFTDLEVIKPIPFTNSYSSEPLEIIEAKGDIESVLCQHVIKCLISTENDRV